jgi:hypothetical protein
MRTLLLLSSLLLTGYSLLTRPAVPPATKGSAERAAYTRAEINALVGKAPAEVRAALGEPESVDDYTDATGTRTIWFLPVLVEEPLSGRTERGVQVVFEQGRTVRVGYMPVYP